MRHRHHMSHILEPAHCKHLACWCLYSQHRGVANRVLDVMMDMHMVGHMDSVDKYSLCSLS